MNRNQTLRVICALLFSTVLYSCKTNKDIATGTKTRCNVEFKGANWLAANLKQNELRFETFDGKINVASKIDSSENNFSVNVRVRKDSLIWMSISKVGIEALRVYITPDSVIFIDRLKKTYFKGDFEYLTALLNTELDYEIFQSLLVGNSVSFYDDEEKIKASVYSNKCQYLLGTIRKRKLKKITIRGKELKESAQSIYMQPENFKIRRILFYDFNLNRSFNAEFNQFDKIDSTQHFPSKINFNIKAEKNIDIDLEYTKYRLNRHLTYSFKIPENYEQVFF